jgi:hypothetical protein
VIYTQAKEDREIRRHFDFLRTRGFLKGQTEIFDVEELPGVQGIKALRVEIDFESSAISERTTRMSK